MINVFGQHPFKGIEYKESTILKSISMVCGYCGNQVAPNRGYAVYAGNQPWLNIYMCPHCGYPIIYCVRNYESLPGELCGRGIKNLPDNISVLYDECRTNYSNKCYTSAQMIARTILMHIAVEQGADENLSFAKYVEYLDLKGYIPPNGKKWVDFIRTSGNQANHEIIIKEKEETEKVISFLSMLLLFIYELPNTEMN